MKQFPNIALTGKFRSGKDEVARYLCDKYGYKRFAFGDALKRHYHELFGPTTGKDREGYQWFGQTMRERDPNIWVRKCFAAIDEMRSEWFRTRAVITDLRQPNEYDRCRSEGFVIVRINCPDEIRIGRARAAGDDFTTEDLHHETEQYVDTFGVDFEIDNSGTLDELYAQVDEIMAKLSGEVTH